MTAPIYTLGDYHRRRSRRERILLVAAVLVGAGVPLLLAWLALGMLAS